MTTTISPELTSVRPRMRVTMAVGAAALFAGLGAGLVMDDAFDTSSSATEPAPALSDVDDARARSATQSSSLPMSADGAERWAASQEIAGETACTSGGGSADAVERCLTELRTPRG